MAGNLLIEDVTTVVPAVTNLQSLASSQTWVTGFSTIAVSNLSNNYRDYRYGGTFTTHASNRQAGTINVWVVGALNDSALYPAVSSGTLGSADQAITWADIYRRNAVVRLLASIEADNTASAIYTFPMTGIRNLFGGYVPTSHCLYISVNTTTTTSAGLASSGNAIYYTPAYDQYT